MIGIDTQYLLQGRGRARFAGMTGRNSEVGMAREAPEARADGRETLALVVNGQLHAIEAPPALPLLDVLRNRLGLTGTKEACGRGECGACTVLLGGVPYLSCITLAGLVDGPVVTIEGLGDEWSDLRRAFADHG